MAGLIRLTTVWQGFLGAPGYTNFYCHDAGTNQTAVADSFANSVQTFWLAVNGYLPAAVSVDISQVWQAIDDETGDILTEGNRTQNQSPVVGNSGAVYAGNAGFAINWGTDVFIRGRRLKGRTYIVPSAGAFSTDGTLSDAALTAILEAATALSMESEQRMKIWHRPIEGAGGSSSYVSSVAVSDRAAILRSRSV